MKYIIKNSDIFINGKLISEGSEIELSEEQSKGIGDFLITVSNPEPISDSAIVSGSSESKSADNNVNNIKSKGNKK